MSNALGNGMTQTTEQATMYTVDAYMGDDGQYPVGSLQCDTLAIAKASAYEYLNNLGIAYVMILDAERTVVWDSDSGVQ